MMLDFILFLREDTCFYDREGGKMKGRKKLFFGKSETNQSEKRPPKPTASPLVVLHGRKTAVLYDCKRILRYERNEILLLCGRERLTITGQNLFCSSFSSGAVTVEGRIASLRFSEGGEGER